MAYIIVRCLITLLIGSYLFGRAGGITENERMAQTGQRYGTTSSAEKEAIREWFSAVLGLQNLTDDNNHGSRSAHRSARIHTPQYVQNLYDLMALEADGDQPAGRRRRSLDGGLYNFATGGSATSLAAGPVTIQAVARDATNIAARNISVSNAGYLLHFNLHQLWIPNSQLQLAELVMAVDYTRLIGPPGSYTVYAYLLDDERHMINSHRARLLVSTGSLGGLDTFRDSFVKLNVTESVFRRLLAGNSPSATFEIFVAFDQTYRPGDGGGSQESKRDLDLHEISNLLHLSSHGTHQPLLVLYSETAANIGEQTGRPAPGRRRRSAPNPVRKRDWRHPDAECGRHEWWIDVADVFKDTIIMPEGFYAYFCAGSCHHPMLHDRWNATANAHLRSVYNAKWRHEQLTTNSNTPSDIPDVKCVAQSYLPITVIFNYNGSYVIKRLDDMVVGSCMCA